MKTHVLLRETKEKVEVPIRDNDKPTVNEIMMEKWQKIINLVADLLAVPAGLIMQITDTHMEVFLRSENTDNPYPEDGKDTLLHGLYCETVIGTDNALHVDNSLHHKAWEDNPDVKLDMISYYGLPIKWGDGTFFGTICALDSKTNVFEQEYRDLMLLFKDIIETDLIQLQRNQEIVHNSEHDVLTNAFNRRKFDAELDKHFDKYQRYGHGFSLVLLDLDGFKYINDKYGHVEGDRVLVRFSQIVMNRIRKVDSFYRYGGDEFSLILGNREQEDIKIFNLKFIYGIYKMDSSINATEELITYADKNLYKSKREKT